LPSTLALTHRWSSGLYNYTLNRITLFALIFSIGILVDDAIVIVENIVRHYHLPHNKRTQRPWRVAMEAVVGGRQSRLYSLRGGDRRHRADGIRWGLMGPYMRPIPVGASAAMIYFACWWRSWLAPWAAVRLLRTHHGKVPMGDAGKADGHHSSETLLTRAYRRVMKPLLAHVWARWSFLAGITLLLLAAMALVYTRHVQVKMLPFDNKSEFQVIIDMPEGTTLEATTAAAAARSASTSPRCPRSPITRSTPARPRR
jgi:multidrug efflux pump subunit AcrB